MFKIKSATRLAISVGFICTSLLWLALSMNLVPDPRAHRLDHQLSLTRVIAVSVSTFAENNRFLELKKILDRNVQLESEIVSIGLRREIGTNNLMGTEHHASLWKSMDEADQEVNQVAVDIMSNGRKWGQLEIVFQPDSSSFFVWLFGFPNGLMLFLTSSLILVTWYMLNKTFRYLNPSKVVPNRVRSALDSIGSGLVLVTPSGEIAHANRAFGNIVQCDVEQIAGTRMEQYNWQCSEDGPRELPWVRCQRAREAVAGDIVEARIAAGVTQEYMVNATPILGAKDQSRGMLVSFEDVTALESKKAELARIIQTVRMSRDEVERQNEQLTFLASYDPLTKCMNRRSFFPHFERMWAEDQQFPLTIFMLDIDHFKSVNDDHGHSTGDEVLKNVGALLNEVVGSRGIVCRYGGEEFSILLPGLPVDECCGIAEQVRSRIETDPIAGLKITASLGLSNKSFGAMDPQHMLDQADQCLYIAKRNGRNQVVRFNNCPAVEEEGAESEVAVQESAGEVDANSNDKSREGSIHKIEDASVTGLLSALALRSPITAEHSVRVADLAVSLGAPLLDKRTLYNLEIAALLHDVGKIGIPDTILNKPDALNAEEWAVMRRHDEIGLNIVRNSFAAEIVAETIQVHHQRATKNQLKSHDCVEETVCSRILTVCDAFDSMVTDHPYRKGMAAEQALAEILANTPAHFDPFTVNCLVKHVASGSYRSQSRIVAAHDTECEQLLALAESVMELCDSTIGCSVKDNTLLSELEPEALRGS